MLSEKRIKEAESNVKSYLEEGLLSKTEFSSKIFDILKKNAQESLNVANFLSKNNKSSLWIIVTSYYSMFYLANALIYKLGYKVGSKIAHKVAADALIVFARNKIKQSLIESYEDIRDEALATIKSEELIEYLDYERKKRNFIQYDTPETIKISRVKTSLERARVFMLQIGKLLED
jgi:uncharacterized protein (UPF0332 family)